MYGGQIPGEEFAFRKWWYSWGKLFCKTSDSGVDIVNIEQNP
jgi:hypothetical protein